jgi:hypothetical protein
MERVVNLIGMGISAIRLPDTGENWGINFAFKRKNLHKLFFMERLMDWLPHQDNTYEPRDYTFDMFLREHPQVELISHTDTIVNDKQGNKLADITIFPLIDSLKLIPGTYFTSTAAYMVAFALVEKEYRINLAKLILNNLMQEKKLDKDKIAIAKKELIKAEALQKVDRIRLYGFEAWCGADAVEYNYQRPCLEFWLAFAMGRGITVESPYYLMLTNNSHQNLYGYAAFDSKIGFKK